MKKLRKAVLAVMLTSAFALTGTSSLVTHAASEASVKLHTNDMWVNTDPIKTKEAAYRGTTNAENPRSVWFIGEYKNSSGWHYDTKILVAPGINCPTSNTSRYSAATKLRLQINPYGNDTTGCRASGKIWCVSQD